MAEGLLLLGFRVFSWLPLPVIQGVGVVAGMLFHACKPKSRRVLAHNLRASGLYPGEAALAAAVRENIRETGKTLAESLALWGATQQRALGWIKRVDGQECIAEALAAKQGIIFLTPHLGQYEITALYYAAQQPITVLYRPPRKSFMRALVCKGRAKGWLKLAATDRHGVKALLAALRQGEAVGILPDQTASLGQGAWCDFFGQQTYATTLVGRLAAATGAQIIMASGERLPGGRGFILHLSKLDAAQVAEPGLLMRQVEQQIRVYPQQYLWNYDRQRHVPRA